MQEESLVQEQQIKSLEIELTNCKHQLKNNDEKMKQNCLEIANKDEQLVLVKVELQSVLDKFKIKSEDVK